MVAVIATLGVVLGILLFAEAVRKVERLSNEHLRKLVHIAVGAFVSVWPFYLSTLTIEILCLAFIAVIVVSRYFNLFRSIHSIDRKSWGDILFPLGIAITVLLAQSPWIFMAAMLHLSLADGIAAVVGTKYKKTRRYTILGQTKSVAGTLAFWLVSVLIISFVLLAQYAQFGQAATGLLLVLPIVATLLENTSPQGMDNIVVPFAVTVMLNAALVTVV